MAATAMVPTGDGRVLAVCEWGPPEGAPVFFLHGTPGSRYLRHPGDRYDRTGLRVLTYDRPGYGRSTRHAGRAVVDDAADVAAIAQAFGLDRFGVAGVSGGGPPALAVAAAYPDRVTRCAVLVSGPPPRAEGLDLTGVDEELLAHWRRTLQEGEDYLLGEFDEVASWVEAGMPDLASLPEDHRDLLREAFTEAVAAGPWGFVDDCLAQVGDWGFAVEDVDVPTRVMLAREDQSVPPSHAEWLERHLRRGEVVWVDGGHFGPRDAEEMQLMRWVGGAADPRE